MSDAESVIVRFIALCPGYTTAGLAARLIGKYRNQNHALQKLLEKLQADGHVWCDGGKRWRVTPVLPTHGSGDSK